MADRGAVRVRSRQGIRGRGSLCYHWRSLTVARVSTRLCAVLLALSVVGCEAVRSTHVASDAEREAARDLVAQIVSIASQPMDRVSILQATSFAPIVGLAVRDGTPALPQGRSSDEEPADCLIATETSVTYSQCALADHLVDGIWSAQLSRVHAELVDVFVVGPGVHGSVAVEANLSAGSDISGTMNIGFMWSVGSEDHVLDADIRIDGLVLEGPRCATAGSLTITGGLGDPPGTTTTLWFGPGCQDVAIAP